MGNVTAFGLDLSGYSGEGSSLAEVRRKANGTYSATVFRGHPFAQSREGRHRLATIVNDERAALASLLRNGHLLVDVPIDLQSLPEPTTPHFIWELTARPIDFAYGALRPLADRIGAPVARFRHIVADQSIRDATESGGLIETYPAASLLCMKLPSEGYKKQKITWDDGRWIGENLADIAQGLRLVATSAVTLTDDDIDAIICALVGVVPSESVLADEELALDMRARLRKKVSKTDEYLVERLQVPARYRLLRRVPEVEIHVALSDWKKSC